MSHSLRCSYVILIIPFVLTNAAPQFPNNMQGNVGLQGGGYGDMYGGKVQPGIYGAGGRFGGGMGLSGAFGPGSGSGGSGAPGAPAPPAPGTAAPAPPPVDNEEPCAKRKRRSADTVQSIPFPIIIPDPASIMNSVLGAPMTATSNGVSSIAAQTVDESGTVVSTGGIVLPGTRIA